MPSCVSPEGGGDGACVQEQVKALEKALAESQERENALKEVLARKEEALRTTSSDLVHVQREHDVLEMALDAARAVVNGSEGGATSGASSIMPGGCEEAGTGLGKPVDLASEMLRLKEQMEQDMRKGQQRVVELETENLRREKEGVYARSKAEEAEEALRTAREEVGEARSKLLATERELEEARRDMGVREGSPAELVHEDLSKELTAAREDLTNAQAELKRAKDEVEVAQHEAKEGLANAQAEIKLAKQQVEAAQDKARESVAQAQEQSREMLKKAVEAKKLLQNKLAALADENRALQAKLSGGAEEEEWVKKLRSERDESRVQLDEMSKRLEEVLLEKEEDASKLNSEIGRLESRCAENEAVAAVSEEKVAALEARALEAERRAALEEDRARQAASAASGSREQLMARQDELCRKLNDAEEAAAKVRRKTEVDAAAARKAACEALEEKVALVEKGEERIRALTAELAAVKEAAGESESLREQMSAQGKELAVSQRKLLEVETEKEASARMLNAELESVKEKSKQYIKKAVDQQKILQARVRELEGQVESVQGAASRAEGVDAELVAAREAKESAEASLQTVTAEFERYKMRAHTLLKKADENGGGGRDVTGMLEDLTRQIASKEMTIKTLREQAAEQDKRRAAAVQAADERERDAQQLREDLDAAAAASAGEVRVLNLKMQSLQKEAASGEESRSMLAFLTHALQLEVTNFEARVQGAELALADAAQALSLLRSQLVESQMQVRDLQRRACISSSTLSHTQQPANLHSSRRALETSNGRNGPGASANGMPTPSPSSFFTVSGGEGPADFVGGVSPFDARARSALAKSAAAEAGQGRGLGPAQAPGAVGLASDESVRLASLLTGGAMAAEGVGEGGVDGGGAESNMVGVVSAEDLQRLQRGLEEQRARLAGEQEAAQLYVSRMKDELASAISGGC